MKLKGSRKKMQSSVDLNSVKPLKKKNATTIYEKMLYVENISTSFSGLQVLQNLSLTIMPGELRCLIGPNGAGKSTLIDVITGRIKPQFGSIFLGQTTDLTKMTEAEIVRAGVGRKFQKPSVFPLHTVYENLELALNTDRGVWSSLFSTINDEQRVRIDAILELLGLEDKRNFLGGSLSHGQKQWLSIGMLLAQNPKVLLIDEPVAGMTEFEIEKTAALLTSLRGSHTVIVIEHDMHFIRSIAETVSVLHQGRILAEGTMDEVQNDVRVQRVYLGE